jgi:predicted XRE-type DNA-binding protein
LTLQIYRIIKERGITQTEAGKILGIPQPHVSALARNRAGNFSVGRLIDFLTALGQDVEITVRSAPPLAKARCPFAGRAAALLSRESPERASGPRVARSR